MEKKCARRGRRGAARFNATLVGAFSIEIDGVVGGGGGYRDVFDVAAAVQTAQLPIRMAAEAFKAGIGCVYIYEYNICMYMCVCVCVARLDESVASCGKYIGNYVEE